MDEKNNINEDFDIIAGARKKAPETDQAAPSPQEVQSREIKENSATTVINRQEMNGFPKSSNLPSRKRITAQAAKRPTAKENTPSENNNTTVVMKPVAKNPVNDKTRVGVPLQAKTPSAKRVPDISKPAVSPQKKNGKASSTYSGIVRIGVYLACVLIISAILSILGIKIGNDVFSLVKEDITCQISLSDDSSLSEVADILHENNIIDYPSVFKFYAKLKNSSLSFVGGTYEVSSSSNYDQLIYQLKEKPAARQIVTVTLKEGLTVDETIDLLVSSGCGKRENYIDAIQNHDYDYDFVKALSTLPEGRTYRLEGYLFPDTYQFYTDSPEYYIIDKMLKNFDKKFEKANLDRCEELHMSVDQVITLASMIQKEAKYASDFYIVSSVFHNRLNSSKYLYLESDATTLYWLDKKVEELTQADNHDENNPYSTYVHQGLPPSAIANVGVEAIMAALYPESSDYYFFYTAKDGAILYSKTFDSHLAAKAQQTE